MLNERFMQDIPDEVPEEIKQLAEEGDLEAIDTIDMHAHLLTQLRSMLKLRDEALKKHRVGLDMGQGPIIRLNLLMQHGLGVMSPQRLKLEIDWVRIQTEGLIEGVQQVTARKGGKTLFMPDGTGVEIPPGGENGFTLPPSATN